MPVDLQSIHRGFVFNLTSHTRGTLGGIKQTWPNHLMWFGAFVHLFVRHFCCGGKLGLNGSDYATRQIQMKRIFFQRPYRGTFIFKERYNSFFLLFSSVLVISYSSSSMWLEELPEQRGAVVKWKDSSWVNPYWPLSRWFNVHQCNFSTFFLSSKDPMLSSFAQKQPCSQTVWGTHGSVCDFIKAGDASS